MVRLGRFRQFSRGFVLNVPSSLVAPRSGSRRSRFDKLPVNRRLRRSGLYQLTDAASKVGWPSIRALKRRALRRPNGYPRGYFGDAQKECSYSPVQIQRYRARVGRTRAYTRILKVARTIADLDGADTVGTAQVAEAIQYRALDRAFH